jgi:GT2 family glycosyltransferase
MTTQAKTKVTVGIPTLNGADRLQRCLWSIATCTDLDGVRVLICDDGSRPEVLQDVRNVVEGVRMKFPSLELLENGTRRGIAKSWNRLARHYADAEVIALLNDDIEVVNDWLDVLVFSVMENPKAGMVGLNSYCALMKTQHASLFPPDTLEHVRIPRVDYREAHLMSGGGKLLSSQGPIFALRRSAFDAVGGFDERYVCFFEEVDLGVSLRKAGYFHYMSNYPLVYHMGGATTSDPKNMDAQADLANSRAKFLEKWGQSMSEIRRDFGPAPVAVEWNSQIKNWT